MPSLQTMVAIALIFYAGLTVAGCDPTASGSEACYDWYEEQGFDAYEAFMDCEGVD